MDVRLSIVLLVPVDSFSAFPAPFVDDLQDSAKNCARSDPSIFFSGLADLLIIVSVSFAETFPVSPAEPRSALILATTVLAPAEKTKVQREGNGR